MFFRDHSDHDLSGVGLYYAAFVAACLSQATGDPYESPSVADFDFDFVKNGECLVGGRIPFAVPCADHLCQGPNRIQRNSFADDPSLHPQLGTVVFFPNLPRRQSRRLVLLAWNWSWYARNLRVVKPAMKSETLFREIGSSTYALRKVHVDAVIVDQNSLHLEVGLLTGFLIFELDEGILQTVAGAFVPNDFA